MTSAPLNALEALLPAVITILYTALIGLGVQASVAKYVSFPRGLGLMCGIGLSLTTLLMIYSHLLFDNVSLPIFPLALIAALIIFRQLATTVNIRAGAGKNLLKSVYQHLANLVTPNDIAAAILAVLILVPVLKYGLAAWTMSMNDFPNYAASAEIWTEGRLKFATEHPDPFGLYQLYRAEFEKPVVVALHLLMSKLSNVSPYKILTPIMVFYLFVFFSSVILFIKKYIKINLYFVYIILAMCEFSVVPVLRVYDAQPGQVAALALVSTLFAVLSNAVYEKSIYGNISLALIVAIVAAAALGSNFTLIVGSSVILGALIFWGFSKRPLLFKSRVILTLISGFIAVFLSLPMIGMYFYSFSIQTTGIHGADIPLPSPLAAIGQQISLLSVGPADQTLVAWGFLAIVVGAILWTVPRNNNTKISLDFLVVLASVLNALLIGSRLGWNNYATHKWVALFIAFAVPSAISYGISLLNVRGKIATAVLLVPLACSSVFLGLRQGFAIPYIFGSDVTSLMNNAELSKQESVNVRLGDMQENSFAALLVPSSKVRVTEPTYAPAAIPEKGVFLVRRDKFDTKSYSDTINLNETYAITSKIIALESESIDFTNKNLDSRRFLFGTWYNAEEWGTWSRVRDSNIVFTLPDRYRAGDLQILIVGSPYSPKDVKKTVEFLVNGKVMSYQHDTKDPRKWNIQIPHDIVVAKDGWIALTIRVDQPLSPSKYGSGDGRTLSFGLSQLKISASR